MKKEYILWGLCGVGALVAIVALSSKLSKKKEDEYVKEMERETGGAFDRYYKNLPAGPYRDNIVAFANDRALVSNYAQRLHDAMKNAGTDIQAINDVMADLDELKMQIVYDRFGKRPYWNYLWGMKTSFGKMMSLKEWFQEELSSEQYKQVKDKYPKLF